MASIQLWVCGEFAFWPATPEAIWDKVSPRRTTCVPSLAGGLAADRGGAAAATSGSGAGVASGIGAGAVAAAACDRVAAGAGGGVGAEGGGDASATAAASDAAGVVSAGAGAASAAGAAAATAAAAAGAAAIAADGVSEAAGSGAGVAGVGADAGVTAERAIVPSRVPAPAAGALTGALATCERPGVNTGGSSSMVYSRTSLPRAQLTSTSSVRKGSEMGSVDLSLITSRPSPVFTVFTCTPERYGGQSRP